MNQLPKPLAAAAGAGDLAVEKVRELSQKAIERLSAMESDPAAFADRVQSNIENRAESFGTTFRSAQSAVREQAQDLGQRAQSLLQTAFEQAEETYETLAKRGETVVSRAGERRTLPDVPGLRMIKPAPEGADEQLDDPAEVAEPAADPGAAKKSADSTKKSAGPAKKSTGRATTSASGSATGKTAGKATGKSSRSAASKTTGNGSGPSSASRDTNG